MPLALVKRFDKQAYTLSRRPSTPACVGDTRAKLSQPSNQAPLRAPLQVSPACAMVAALEELVSINLRFSFSLRFLVDTAASATVMSVARVEGLDPTIPPQELCLPLYRVLI